ncbi:MAG: hypothetical protein DRN14_00035 [Thermoplasmata archaeon]|nr:MAG: hypothetical protein DRN14_00035 [Thermoplasmata archaeon]
MRTDIHCPKNIKPEEYMFIIAIPGNDYGDPFASMEIARRRASLHTFIRDGGHTFSQHEHGGTCHICGAWASHLAYFLHVPTGQIIKTGFDCASNLSMGDEQAFRKTRDLCAAARKRAQMLINARQLTKEVGIPCMECARFGHPILADMWNRLNQYGTLTEKQIKFAKKLIEQVKNPEPAEEIQEPSESAPEGKVTVTGEVLAIKAKEGYFNETVWKMMVRSEAGWRVWCTIPQAISCDVRVGDMIQFTATLTRSDRDKYFAFGKRPSRASIIQSDNKE